MARSWKEYQEEAAAFFRSLGLAAQTNATVYGVRTSHDIDVLVKSSHIGFEITWIIECKHWKSKVSKLHVLALREIVADIGADRGVILSESGFQSGATEAAALTNVRTTSLADLRNTAKPEFLSMRLRELYDRVETCKERYWKIPKEVRIRYGLRPEVGTAGYSSQIIMTLAETLLTKAFRGTYPIQSNTLAALVTPETQRQFASAEELLSTLEPMISELETKLNKLKAQTAPHQSPHTSSPPKQT